MGIASRLAKEIYGRVRTGTETAPAKAPEQKKRPSSVEKTTEPEGAGLSKEAKEARDRAIEQKRVLELSREMDAVALELLRDRLQEDIGEEERDTIVAHMKALDVLKTGTITRDEVPVGIGANGVEEYHILIDGKQTSAFVKLQYGENAYEFDEKEGAWFSMREYLDTNGVSTKAERVAISPEDPNLERLNKDRERIIPQRKIWTEVTGLAPDKLPLYGENQSAIRAMAHGFAVYAEATAHTFALLTRSYHVPPTTLRETGDAVSSIQQGIEKIKTLPQSQEMVSVIIHGAHSPAARKFADLSGFHALNITTDAFAKNSAEEKGKLLDFDNGFTNGLAVPMETQDANGNPASYSGPLEPFVSFPMSLMARPDMQDVMMTDETREKMRRAYEQLTTPGTKGAKLFSLAFRLLYERKDGKGKTIPESTNLARQQSGLYLERLQFLANNGRPPTVPEGRLIPQDIDAMRAILVAHYGTARQGAKKTG